MPSETPDIILFASPFRIELLTQTQLKALKWGTLCLLDEVGLQFPSDRALEVFADRAARVDRENQHPKPLDEAQQRDLARILEAADRGLG